jgi:hypothetical protein
MAGLEGIEPPTFGFGGRCSSLVELQACGKTNIDRFPVLLGFFVDGVLPVELAVLLEFNPFRPFALVARRGVVAAFALCALEQYVFSH